MRRVDAPGYGRRRAGTTPQEETAITEPTHEQTGPTATLRFGPLTIAYDTAVLRPRPWTQAQSRWAADLLRTLPDGPVLELCTGAGHIGLLAVHGSGRDLVAVDADPEACAWARHNAAANGLTADVRHGDVAAVLAEDERFGLIIADPPWVRRAQVDRYPEDPLTAIDGGPDGLALARRCVRVIAAHLAPGGAALLQLGSPSQVENLARELDDHGLVAAEHLVVPEHGTVVLLRRAAPD